MGHVPKRIINPRSYVCTNPDCEECLPHYKDIGEQTDRKCFHCGKRMIRKIQGEPYGTYHSPR